MWNCVNLFERIFCICLSEDCRMLGDRRNGYNFFLVILWILSFMCLSFFFSCVVILVCLKMSLFSIINLCFRVFIDLWVRLDKVMVFWWFFWIVDIILLKCLFIVEMKDDRWWFCWVMVWVNFILLLLRVCMCCFNVLMLFDVVVLKSDFEILFMKLKSFFFCLDDLMYVCCGGNVVEGIKWWIWLMVVFILVIYCICRRLMDLIIWLIVLYFGML